MDFVLCYCLDFVMLFSTFFSHLARLILSCVLLLMICVKCRHGLQGMTPLHMSAMNGHIECCRKLLHAGAMLDILDDWGRNTIHYAAFGGYILFLLNYLLKLLNPDSHY